MGSVPANRDFLLTPFHELLSRSRVNQGLTLLRLPPKAK